MILLMVLLLQSSGLRFKISTKYGSDWKKRLESLEAWQWKGKAQFHAITGHVLGLHIEAGRGESKLEECLLIAKLNIFRLSLMSLVCTLKLDGAESKVEVRYNIFRPFQY